MNSEPVGRHEEAGGRASARPGVTPVLIYRFLLELALVGYLGVWGWRWGGGGVSGTALAILLPVLGALLWGVFAVPDDPSRNGHAPIPVPGPVRLALELGLFGLAAYGIWTSGSRAAAETLLTAVGLNYLLGWDRIAWLLHANTRR